ncbi:glycoside hydrolase family 18 protein, partial [Cadophora sp. DSE1049]
LDRGASNTDLTKTIDIDGFDFDIERTSPDNQAGYIACIKRLREHFAAYKAAKPCSKTYLISGAPQCPLPEGNMGLTIAGAKFDLLFIQFYNNGANGCTARNWITNKNAGGFNYDSWVTIVNQGASAGAKLYLGLLGSSSAGTSGDYLTALEAQSLIDAWHSAPQFGGVMLWEATYAENNLPSSFPGKNYYQIMKQVLNKYAPATTAPATVCSTTVSSTRSSTSSTKTSSSTKISTTSSTVKSSSTSKSASSTKSSTSSKITSTSSSKVSSSSSVKTSSSSTKISSSSSVKPSSSST